MIMLTRFNQIFSIALISLFVFSFSNCEKEENDPPENFRVSKGSLTETSITVNWNQVPGCSGYTVILSTDSAGNNVVLSEPVGPEIVNYTISELNPATIYYCKVICSLGDSEKVESNVLRVLTKYHKEKVFFKANEEITLCANIYYDQQLKAPFSKCIIFIPEIGQNKLRWKTTDLIDSLVVRGFICMCVELRGHGESTPIEDLFYLVESTTALKEDITASINYTTTTYSMEEAKFVLVGASLGAIAATGGSSFENVIGGVAASSVNDFVFVTFGKLVVPKGMFYLAGGNDIGGDPQINFAEDAQRLYEKTDDPKKLFIVAGSDAHGVDLVKNSSDLKKQMIDWISNL